MVNEERYAGDSRYGTYGMNGEWEPFQSQYWNYGGSEPSSAPGSPVIPLDEVPETPGSPDTVVPDTPSVPGTPSDAVIVVIASPVPGTPTDAIAPVIVIIPDTPPGTPTDAVLPAIPDAALNPIEISSGSDSDCD